MENHRHDRQRPGRPQGRSRTTSGWFVILFGIVWASSLLAGNSTPLLIMVVVLVAIAGLTLKSVAQNLGRNGGD